MATICKVLQKFNSVRFSKFKSCDCHDNICQFDLKYIDRKTKSIKYINLETKSNSLNDKDVNITTSNAESTTIWHKPSRASKMQAE